ncbi:MAG: hypothetical protein HOL13_07060 [Phycisphaerae bacterium]|nr:hypothetical protein [Phycisphaerae bacterium]
MLHSRLIPLLLMLTCSCTQHVASPGVAPDLGEIPAPMDASSARRLQLASVILLSTADGMDPSTRAAAAAELVTLHLPQSREILIDAMSTDRIDVLQAVLESMLAESDVNEAYGPSLLALVESAPIEVRPVLAELLARHGQIDVRILPALSMLAADQTMTVEQREAAILAIGAFRHAPAIAASELMMILQQPHAADDPITLAAREQLSRLTGMPRSTTAAQWIAWWKENRNRPSERWLEDTVDALTKQAAARIKELSEARAAREHMSARLLTAYRDFWPLLTIEQQQARLLPLLQDELPSVRVFGLGRLAIQLRDGHDTPGGQEAAAVLLADPDPSVRAAVATLIPELDPATIDPAVIERFYAETNAAVLAAMLPRIAAIQPNLITAEKVTPLLLEPASRAAAINAMWTVLAAAGQTDQDRADALLPAVRKAFELEQTPRAGALLTLIGSPSDVAMLEVRLDDDDSNWRAAIAAAFYTRGEFGPLMTRSGDQAVYPFALRAISSGSDLNTLEAISTLTPPVPHEPLWLQALLEAASRVDADALRIDDILASLPTITPAQRAAILQERFAADQIAEQDLAAIAKRLGPLVLQSGDPRAVVAVIDHVPASRIDDELLALKFEAAIRGRMYDEAAAIQAEPVAWIIAFEQLQAAQPEAADLVRSEIVRRFEDTLDTTMRARLGMASDPMMGGVDPNEVPG